MTLTENVATRGPTDVATLTQVISERHGSSYCDEIIMHTGASDLALGLHDREMN